MKAPLALVVAVSENDCIGKDGALPWHLPEDLRHFRRVTLNHAVVMGRRTHEAIGRPLPRRRNLVLTTQREAQFPGCESVSSLEAAIEMARAGGDTEPRIIGGAEVYKAALPLVTRLFLTRVHEIVEGDTFFPRVAPSEWQEISSRRSTDDRATFIVLIRRNQQTRASEAE